MMMSVVLVAQVDKQRAKFYTIFITQEDIDSGFLISCHSPIASKFKLLMFEQAEQGQWELIVQVMSNMSLPRMPPPSASTVHCGFSAIGVACLAHWPACNFCNHMFCTPMTEPKTRALVVAGG